ncbi:MAG: Dihydrofolate synthase/folylpolyglutamate synthase [Steroidobacteraceae bacterium]|nr:Dihydrofolate synthase/folylpolyglutamate synthase [Steroidobacteraceae bacterium]
MTAAPRGLADWLLQQQRDHPRSIDLGLARVSRVARSLGVDRPRMPTFLVGGTNGKGSTVALLEALLRAAGCATGAFTSPHLVRYNERIRIGGAEAADAALVAAFEAIERARGDTTLTYFEWSTLAALHLFREHGVGAQVLEVGLGGRLDATNLVDADVAALCSIGADHHEWLGPTLEDIGREKAGIFRRARPAVLGTPAMPASVFGEIARIGALPRVAQRDFDWSVDGDRWCWRSAQRTLADLPRPALAGDAQFANAATAIATLEAGPICVSREAVMQGLADVRLAGRFQVVPGEVEWILDVAHNAPAAEVLARNLASRPARGRTIAVAGFLGDKDVGAIGLALRAQVDRWVIATLPPPRGLDARQVVERLAIAQAAPQLCDTVREACDAARALARPGDTIVVFGSFLTVGPALEWLRLY